MKYQYFPFPLSLQLRVPGFPLISESVSSLSLCPKSPPFVENCAHVETKLNISVHLLLDIRGNYIVVICLFKYLLSISHILITFNYFKYL